MNNDDPVHWAMVNAVQELHKMCLMDQEQKEELQKRVDKNTLDILRQDRELASLRSENKILKSVQTESQKKIEKLEKENLDFKQRLERIEKLLPSLAC